MTPLVQKPTVIILIDRDGDITALATNIAPTDQMTVKICHTKKVFDEKSEGQPFSDTLIRVSDL